LEGPGAKRAIGQRDLLCGKPFEKEVKLLISIKGITPLSALAFLSDVGDVRRFKTTRKMNAYLGLVPKLKESGDVYRVGHIRKLCGFMRRMLLTGEQFTEVNYALYQKEEQRSA
jgi:transposase